MERRLAAILAADLVGYSRLMGADEEGTLARLNALRGEIVEPAIAGHRGRVVKTTGDGFLAEFPSAVDAVTCAVAIQNGVAEGPGSGESPLALRIGINVGDVISDRDDLYGDGVNIAARLEGIASAGGICISRTVYDHLGGKADPGFRRDGMHELKNIARPVEVWRWEAGDTAGARPEAPVQGRNPALAVLPFDNMSGDPEQGYFADGIAEDLITMLSKLAQLTVIARNSSFSYKGRAVKVQEIARDLGITHLVEGSVRKAGNRVRVTAQLIDCRDGGHLWAEKFDRNLTDIFEVQDEVTREIVEALAVTLTPGDEKKMKAQGTANLEAYDLYLKGREALYRHGRDTNVLALDLLGRARELDPQFAPAAAYLGLGHMVDYINGWVDDPEHSLEIAQGLACEAVRLDPTFPYAHITLGNTFLWQRRHDEALAAFREAIRQDPNFADGYSVLGWGLHFAGEPEEGIAQMERGMRLDPNYPAMRSHWMAQALYQAGRYAEAVEHLKRRLVRQPHSDVSRALLAACYGQLGQAGEARAAWDELGRVAPDFSLERRRRILPYRDPAAFEHVDEGLRKAGIEA